MKFPALAASFFALLLAARADFTVIEKVEGAGQSGDQVIRVKDGKARCDIGGSVSVIVDEKTGEAMTLAHAQKGYVSLSSDRTKGMLEKMRAARGNQEAKLVSANKKEKVLEYQCDIYNIELGAVKVTYWLAKDYPNYPAILEALDVLESAPISAKTGGLAPRMKDFPGMPVKTVMELGTQKVTTTLVAVKDEAIDPAIFNVPKDYKELPSPPKQ